MKKNIAIPFLCLVTALPVSTFAGFNNKVEATQAYNNLQNNYQKCIFNFNEAKDADYGSPELKCNDAYNQSLVRFIKEVRTGNSKNTQLWKTINAQHIKFSQNCDSQTMVNSYNPSFFIRQAFMCESAAYTSLAQVAIALSY